MMLHNVPHSLTSDVINGIQNENSKLVETIKDLEGDVQKTLDEKEKCEGKISRLSFMIH